LYAAAYKSAVKPKPLPNKIFSNKLSGEQNVPKKIDISWMKKVDLLKKAPKMLAKSSNFIA